MFYHLEPDAFSDDSSAKPTPGWQQPRQHHVSGHFAPCDAWSGDTRNEQQSQTPPPPCHHHELVKNDNSPSGPFLQATAPLPSQHHACAESVAEALAISSPAGIHASARLQVQTSLSSESHSAENSLPITSHDACAATHQPWPGEQQWQAVTHKSMPLRTGTPSAQHTEGAQTEGMSEGPPVPFPSSRHVSTTHRVDTSHVNIPDEAQHYRSHSAKLEGDPHYLG